jgi:hypothetical protein
MKYSMKSLIEAINVLLSDLTFSKEKMPALIPVRVVTKINPDHHK